MPQPIVITPPAVEPITLYQAKQHLRVDTAAEDALINGLIAAARAWAEEYSGRALITQTLELVLECFPHEVIRLPRQPSQDIVSITYTDQNGDTQVIPPDDYRIDTASVFHNVRPAHGKSWPSVRNGPGAVRIRYIAGFGNTGSAVPPHYIQAMLLVIGRYYVMREDVVVGASIQEAPFAAKTLIGPSRNWAV